LAQHRRKLRQLKKEIRRQDKALVEAAALLFRAFTARAESTIRSTEEEICSCPKSCPRRKRG
jgi:hypothetical protein